tara:strand:- start:1176 stop:1967 length:792 start_codon:yes stop_codon:yes gene_type:complete
MGFKLRSGNGPLAFKNMGSSPAKQGLMGVLGAFGGNKNKDIIAPGSDDKGIDTTKAQANTNKPGSKNYKGTDKNTDESHLSTKTTDKKGEVKTKAFKNDASEPATDPNKGKHKDQIKKQAKLDKITERRKRKGKEGLTDRQMKLQKQTSQTGEEYMADKTAKKDADRKIASEILIGVSKNYDPKSQFKSAADQEAQSSTTKRRNQNIEDYELGKNKQMELDDELSKKTDVNGDAIITSTQKVDDANAAKAKVEAENAAKEESE